LAQQLTIKQIAKLAKVAVVILNWNGREFLRKFLPSVLADSQDVAEIIIADNAPTDSSIEFLQDNYPQLRIITNRTNGGFARGYNEALVEVDADYFVLLNSDIEVTPNWIEPVIELMESDKSIAACQPKLRSFHEREKFEYAGAAGGYIDLFGYPFCRGRIISEVETDTGQYNDMVEIFWATGACMFVRRSVFWQAGGFDASFFAHMEEIDLCWRMKNLGYQIAYYPDVTVYHVGGGTLPESPRKLFLNYRNNLALLYKNLPTNKLFTTIFLRLMLDGLSALVYLFSFSLIKFSTVFKAHIAFYRMLPSLRQKRKEWCKSHSLTEHHTIYRRSIVFDFYVSGKRKFSDLSGFDLSKY